MRTVAIISFSDLATDPRVNRQIRFLSEQYRVIAAGWADPQVENVEFFGLMRIKSKVQYLIYSFQLLFRRFERWYWGQKHIKDALTTLSHLSADLIFANDIDTLPLALRIAGGAKVIFDAHEYAPREHEELFFWKVLFQKYKTYLCNIYVPKVNAMMTVCQGIADTYKKDSGIDPVVITNAPDFEVIQPNLPENKTTIRLVHHGLGGPSRGIDKLIKMMDYLDDRFELDLILIEAWPGYIKYLKRLAKNSTRIHFLPPVPMRALPKHLNPYDIGVFLLDPVNFNYLHALPNKFFEFIQARLAIAIGPSPEMTRIVKEHDLGVVAEDFSPEALAHCLSGLDRYKINYYKLQSHRVARLMSAEENKKIFQQLVQQVLGD